MADEVFLKKLTSAVQSVTSSTDVFIKLEDLKVDAHNLCSPYVSRHIINYEYDIGVDMGSVLIWNSNYVVGIFVDDDLIRKYSPLVGYVKEVRRQYVPKFFIAAVTELVEKLVGKRLDLPNLVEVSIVVPQVGAWWQRSMPVYELDIPTLGNKIAEQGHLEIYEVDDDVRGVLNHILYYENISLVGALNHVVVNNLYEHWPEDVKPQRPLGAYKGNFVWKLASGKYTATSPDHDQIEFKSDRMMVLVHPVPRNGVD